MLCSIVEVFSTINLLFQREREEERKLSSWTKNMLMQTTLNPISFPSARKAISRDDNEWPSPAGNDDIRLWTFNV